MEFAKPVQNDAHLGCGAVFFRWAGHQKAAAVRIDVVSFASVGAKVIDFIEQGLRRAGENFEFRNSDCEFKSEGL